MNIQIIKNVDSSGFNYFTAKSELIDNYVSIVGDGITKEESIQNFDKNLRFYLEYLLKKKDLTYSDKQILYLIYSEQYENACSIIERNKNNNGGCPFINSGYSSYLYPCSTADWKYENCLKVELNQLIKNDKLLNYTITKEI